MSLNDKQKEICEGHQYDFSGISALILNCTLKPSGQLSHTEKLLDVCIEIMNVNSIDTEIIRPVDFDIPPGVYPDMTKHGFKKDDWPGIMEKVLKSEILIIGSPIWLGEESSVCRTVIERLYGESGNLNSNGQYLYYGKTGGCIITGNEDGIKHCSMSILYAMQHLGYTIPPQADAGWIGEAGPGASYADEGSGGVDNEFTQRNTTFMSWNLMHMAKLLKDSGGIPAHGNQRSAWDAGCRFDHPNPDYR